MLFPAFRRGRLKYVHPMHDNTPIFIHAWWRSSSTYIWSKLRQDMALCCYYEPLNERIATLTPDIIKAGPEKGMSLSLRHPVQTENYFTEYLDLIASGSLRYSKDLAYARYLLRPDQSDAALYAYLDGLISAASRSGRRPVLCFCRSQMRSGWIKRNFDGIHVCQIRNPVDQWASFQVNPYFIQRMVNVAFALRATYPCAFAHIDQFELQAEAFSKQDSIQGAHQRTFSLDRRDALDLFLVIWLASALQAIAYCDYLLDVDRLASDAHYRQETSRWFQASGCAVDFSDCATPTTAESRLTAEMLHGTVRKAVNAVRSNASCLVLSDPEVIAARLPSLSSWIREVLGLWLPDRRA